MVKELVERHGGSVSLQSPADEKGGACIDIQLPLVSVLREPSARAAAD